MSGRIRRKAASNGRVRNFFESSHAHWPELIEANILHGVHGTQLADGEIHELRRKNVNYAIEIDGKAIAPLGGGMAGDGSSVLCTIFASKLLEDLRYHEEGPQ